MAGSLLALLVCAASLRLAVSREAVGSQRFVNNPAALRQALEQETETVIVTEHLDLSSWHLLWSPMPSALETAPTPPRRILVLPGAPAC
jgi:hypothetical protein